MNKLQYTLGPMRLPFLVLTPACVLVGLGTAVWSSGRVNALHVVLVLVGAVSAHISVNSFNEYFDFRSGLDARTKRTPFSGGSGALPARPGMARRALGIATIALLLTAAIGVYFLQIRGLGLLPLGVLGLAIIVIYTPWLSHSPVLCLIAPGLGFGSLIVMGTHFALTGRYAWTPFFGSLVPFFLVSDLLLLNQFPDVEADRSVGRRHFPIVIGRKNSSLIYGAFLLATYLSIAAAVWLAYLPATSLMGLIPLCIAVPTMIGAYRHADNLEKLVPYLGCNVILNLVTPVLVAVGLLVA